MPTRVLTLVPSPGLTPMLTLVSTPILTPILNPCASLCPDPHAHSCALVNALTHVECESCPPPLPCWFCAYPCPDPCADPCVAIIEAGAITCVTLTSGPAQDLLGIRLLLVISGGCRYNDRCKACILFALSRGQNTCLHGWWVCIKSRCALHTVMSNIHMVGCMDCNSTGVLFEGKASLVAAAGTSTAWKNCCRQT